MNEPENPDDDAPGNVMIAAGDLPPGLADAIEQAINKVHTPELVDYGFIIQRARASGWGAKQLLKVFPGLPEWARAGLLKGTLTMDVHGYLHSLH